MGLSFNSNIASSVVGGLPLTKEPGQPPSASSSVVNTTSAIIGALMRKLKLWPLNEYVLEIRIPMINKTSHEGMIVSTMVSSHTMMHYDCI